MPMAPAISALGMGRRVVVVGAGVSGLHAARRIKELGGANAPHVTVLEADGCAGGRVRQANGWADWPVELGAEWLHGDQCNPVFDACAPLGCMQAVGSAFPQHVWTGDALVDVLADDAPADLHVLREGELGYGASVPGEGEPDRSMRAYNDASGISARARELVEASWYNSWGGGEDTLGQRELQRVCDSWVTGEADHFLCTSFAPFIEALCDGIDVVYGAQVVRVEQRGAHGAATVYTADGRTWHADAVVVSVSIAVLREGDIAFDPPLSPRKQDALARIQYARDAIKVVLLLREDVFPPHIHSVVCGASHGVCPEVWVRRPCAHHHAAARGITVVGFWMGERAERVLREHTRGELAALLVAQVDRMLGTAGRAAAALERSMVVSWRDDMPFVRCGYAFPTLGTGRAEREAYARREGALFFCGEAANVHADCTLQGCVASAHACARAVHEAWGDEK